MSARILRLNSAGIPTAWVTKEEAATLYVKRQVMWSLGDDALRILGGYNNQGERSSIAMAPIIACEGFQTVNTAPALSNAMLFRRDDHRCMYCGFTFSDKQLTRDHVVPKVQQGPDSWNNVVAACKRCNNHKGGRTPEEANMPLLAVPFTPNVFEYMYLSNRTILGDQMAYLESRFSEKRCWLVA